MTSYVFQNKADLVNHLFAKLEKPSSSKIQKTLYLLFAFYGATYGRLKADPSNELETVNYPTYLFEPNFEAWRYGPVDPEVQAAMNKQAYEPFVSDIPNIIHEGLELEDKAFANVLDPSEVRNIRLFIDNIIEQTDNTDDFTLIGRVCEDDTWTSVVKGDGNCNDKIISPQSIVDEYIAKYV